MIRNQRKVIPDFNPFIRVCSTVKATPVPGARFIQVGLVQIGAKIFSLMRDKNLDRSKYEPHDGGSRKNSLKRALK